MNFYLFGNRRIKQLEDALETQQRLANIQQTGWANSEKRVAALEASELKLMGQIRDMDQLIFQMSQKTSWDQQRPIFNQLLEQTNRRMALESDRIKTLLIPEMKKAYR